MLEPMSVDSMNTRPVNTDLMENAALSAHFVDLQQQITRLEAEWLETAAVWERRQAWGDDGALSGPGWLVHHTDMAASTAREKLRVARTLTDMPKTRDAFAHGDISYSHVRVLARAVDADTAEAFADYEATLVEAAGRLSVTEFAQAVRHWRNHADPDGALADADREFGRRKLHCSRTFEGSTVLDARFDPESGAIVGGAIDTFTERRWHAQRRGDAAASAPEAATPGQLRADALVEICERALATLDESPPGRARPLLSVVADLDSLQGRIGRLCELEGSGTISGDEARRWACDTDLVRVITRGRSEILDLGRRSRTVTTAQRRALVLRDGGCAFPGCDRPPEWCDAHHIVHWLDGGPTDLDNLVLLCRRHHRLLHRPDGFGMARDPTGWIVFSRPDGSVIESRPRALAAA